MEKENVLESAVFFVCEECGREVATGGSIGTKNRNHCPYCLASKHLDEKLSGDRASHCGGLMLPIALTFKREGFDKYGKPKRGELMLVHRCKNCGDISINRLAGDDDEGVILKLFAESMSDEKLREELYREDISILKEKDKEEIYRQLFGKVVSSL